MKYNKKFNYRDIINKTKHKLYMQSIKNLYIINIQEKRSNIKHQPINLHINTMNRLTQNYTIYHEATRCHSSREDLTKSQNIAQQLKQHCK